MAAGRIVLSSNMPARDRSDRLVSGALLYVYTNGTTTKASIYSDVGLTTPLSNPVVANSSGAFVSIWAEAGTTDVPVLYTLSLTGPNGESLGNPSVWDDFSPSLDWASDVTAAARTVLDDTTVAAMRTTLGADLAANVNFTQAGAGGITEALQDYLRTLPISVRTYGAVADGATDCTAAVTNALARLSALGGGTLRFPRGSYAFASASLGVGIVVPNNVKIDLDGSTLTITGTAITDCLFKVTDVSNFTVENGIVIGNSQANGYNNGAFCNVVMSGSATANMVGIFVRNIEMRNFKANYWLAVQNLDTTYEIQTVRIENVRGISQSGNNQGGGIGILAHAVVIDGNLGPVRDVIVDGLYVEAQYIKGGAIFRGEVIDGAIRNPVIRDAGLSHGLDDEASYAIAVYDSGGVGMKNLTIENPVITDPRDCGIYAAAGENLTITNPLIEGQTAGSAATVSLPKGAIAINQVKGATVIGGTLKDNAYDLYLIPPTTNEPLRFVGCTTKGSSEAAMVIGGSGTARAGVYIEGGTYDGAKEGLVSLNRTASYVSNIQARGATFIGRAGSGVNLGVFGETCASTGILFSGCAFMGTAQGLYAGKITGDVTLTDNVSLGLSGSVYGVDIRDSTNVTVRGLSITDQGGTGLYAVGTQGSLESVRFSNVGTNVAATSLGLAAPSHSGVLGHAVQNLDPAATEYAAWMCMGGTTWKGFGLIET